MTVFVSIQGLSVSRGRNRLFEGLDLTLSAGDCVEVRGANGTGKSTLLRCIAGLYQDFQGELTAEPCAYLGHNDGLSALLTVEENLRWYAGLSGGSASSKDIAAALATLEASHLVRRQARALSAGQHRRVALARLPLLGHKLWLLDEPYTALDDAGTALVDGLIRDHCASGGAVMAATHADMSVSTAQCWVDR